MLLKNKFNLFILILKFWDWLNIGLEHDFQECESESNRAPEMFNPYKSHQVLEYVKQHDS
jgi:hypothetical protein